MVEFRLLEDAITGAGTTLVRDTMPIPAPVGSEPGADVDADPVTARE
jgi:hypothetical protein